MGSNRVLKLTNQGEIQLFEQIGNGTSKVSVKAPASLSGDVTFQLPDSGGSVGQFLKSSGSGVTSWANGTSTLDSAYDNGYEITVDSSPVTLSGNLSDYVFKVTQAADNNNLVFLQKTTSGSGTPLNITNAGTSVSVQITNTSTGGGIYINQDGAARALNIQQSGATPALDIYHDANADVIQITKAATTSGNLINLTNSGSGYDIDGTASSWFVEADGDATFKDVTATGGISATGDISAAGGYRSYIGDWYYIDLPANTTANLKRSNADISASILELRLPRAGSITGLVVKSNGTVSTGSVTINARINYTNVFSVVLNSGTVAYATQAKDIDTFTAGEHIDLQFTTSSDWAHTTYEIIAELEIET